MDSVTVLMSTFYLGSKNRETKTLHKVSTLCDYDAESGAGGIQQALPKSCIKAKAYIVGLRVFKKMVQFKTTLKGVHSTLTHFPELCVLLKTSLWFCCTRSQGN